MMARTRIHLVSFTLIWAVGGLSSHGLADTYGEPINVRIANQTGTDRAVEVTDNVCHEQVLDQRIAGNSSVPVQLCTIALQGGDATVRDMLSGAEKRYQQVTDSAELAVP